jgi:hypothetical protein
MRSRTAGFSPSHRLFVLVGDGVGFPGHRPFFPVIALLFFVIAGSDPVLSG